tara:strand:- start:1659 stop:2279 length:621 start_codon:yes stop_codon:yes gene_type:complete
MLLDEFDVDQLFRKKCQCFGATGATIATIVGTTVTAAGMIQQGQAQAAQANYQAKVAQNNALVARQQATRAQQQADLDKQDFLRNQSDLLSSRRALLGGVGVSAGAGSPLAVSSDFAGETALNALRIQNQGEVEANRLQQAAVNQQAQAGLFRAQGRQAQTGSFFRAGGTLLSGIGKASGGFKSPSGGGSTSTVRGQKIIPGFDYF